MYKKIWYLLTMSILILTTAFLQRILTQRSRASCLKDNMCETQCFREQTLPTELAAVLLKRYDGSVLGRTLSAVMLNGNFCPSGIDTDARVYEKYKPDEFDGLSEAYQAIWGGLSYFPVAGKNITFEDSFGERRDYGGERSHEGCDLFGEYSVAGYYPIVSITDGEVEQVGWLPLGGYRIGIRSPEGGYFYYAHLSSYERVFEIGEQVSAGDILGFMGDSGYGTEGTTGKFPVHLHMGIYIRTPHYDELSVNPYWILKALEKKVRNYQY